MVHLPFHVQKQYEEKISSKGMDYLLTPKDTAKLREQSIRPTMKTADTMHLLRIGKYKDRGETVTAIRQIHSDQPPASFNNKQRTAQRRLFNDIRDDFSKYLFDNRIDDVMSWVEMTESQDIMDEIKVEM
eukprot:scaffold6436_cov80-Skeletonema_marinoi.AAC.1